MMVELVQVGTDRVGFVAIGVLRRRPVEGVLRRRARVPADVRPAADPHSPVTSSGSTARSSSTDGVPRRPARHRRVHARARAAARPAAVGSARRRRRTSSGCTASRSTPTTSTATTPISSSAACAASRRPATLEMGPGHPAAPGAHVRGPRRHRPRAHRTARDLDADRVALGDRPSKPNSADDRVARTGGRRSRSRRRGRRRTPANDLSPTCGRRARPGRCRARSRRRRSGRSGCGAARTARCPGSCAATCAATLLERGDDVVASPVLHLDRRDDRDLAHRWLLLERFGSAGAAEQVPGRAPVSTPSRMIDLTAHDRRVVAVGALQSRGAPAGRSWSISGRRSVRPSKSMTLRSAFLPGASTPRSPRP